MGFKREIAEMASMTESGLNPFKSASVEVVKHQLCGLLPASAESAEVNLN